MELGTLAEHAEILATVGLSGVGALGLYIFNGLSKSIKELTQELKHLRHEFDIQSGKCDERHKGGA